MTDAEQFYASILCLALLGLTIIAGAWIALDRNERRANRQSRQPDPIDVAQDFHDDLDRDFALWARECGRSA